MNKRQRQFKKAHKRFQIELYERVIASANAKQLPRHRLHDRVQSKQWHAKPTDFIEAYVLTRADKLSLTKEETQTALHILQGGAR